VKVTVLGTGIMGTGITHSLLRAGHDVTVWNRTAERARPLEADGAHVAATSGEAVATAEVVLGVLFDADAVLAVLAECADAVPARAVWLQASTVGVEGTARIADAAARAGVTLVETMLVGTRQPAESGTLTLLTSGDPAVLDRVHPVLDAIGARQVRVGPQVGQATALKLACNAWVAVLTAGTAQSMALAGHLGLDPTTFLEAITGAPIDSAYARIKGTAMAEGAFAPSFAVDALAKDLGLMLDAAHASRMPTTLLDPLLSLFTSVSEAGRGGEDIAAVISRFETGTA